jgi:hypothetical protein
LEEYMSTEAKPTNNVDPFIEIPAKVCVQIGLRKRYYPTKEEALAALKAYTDNQNRPKQRRNASLSPEEKVAKAVRYAVYSVIAAHEGYTGKRAVMAANAYEEVCQAPGAFDCVAVYAETIETGASSEFTHKVMHPKDKRYFTDNFIAGLKPKEDRYFIREARGFAVRVLPSGLKTWFFIYTWKGLRKHMNLGAYPGVTLAQARKRYTEAYNLFQQGIDPMPPKAVDK